MQKTGKRHIKLLRPADFGQFLLLPHIGDYELFLKSGKTKPRSPSVQSNGVHGGPWTILNPLSLSG